MKLLLAGFGNLLRQDDAFGVRLAQLLSGHPALPPGADVLEVGIGGISMVQDLMGGYDALIVLDALDGDEPGRVRVLRAEVPDAADLPRDYLADVHYAEPGRALVLAKAVGVLPDTVYIVGAVAGTAELGEDLTPALAAALAPAAATVLELANELTRTSELAAGGS